MNRREFIGSMAGAAAQAYSPIGIEIRSDHEESFKRRLAQAVSLLEDHGDVRKGPSGQGVELPLAALRPPVGQEAEVSLAHDRHAVGQGAVEVQE